MNERQCEDCGKPISICNAVTAVNVAVTRNGKDAVSAELSRADLCADPALLAEAVEVLRGLLIAADGDSYGDYFNAIEAGHAFLAKLENRHDR